VDRGIKQAIETKIIPLVDVGQILISQVFSIHTKYKKADYSTCLILSFDDNSLMASILSKMVYTHFSVLNIEIHRFTQFCLEILSFGVLSDLQLIPKEANRLLHFLESFFNMPRIQNQWITKIPVIPLSQHLVHLRSELKQFQNHAFFTFLSSCVTAILSNHLSWTIPYLKDRSDTKSINIMERILSSYYGSGYWNYIENPIDQSTKKFCRVVILGSNKKLMSSLSSFLTFFLRSDEILEKSYSLSFKHILPNQIDGVDIQKAKLNSLHLSPSTPSSLRLSELKIKIVGDRGQNDLNQIPSSDEEDLEVTPPSSLGSNIGKMQMSSLNERQSMSTLPKSILDRIIFEKREMTPNSEAKKIFSHDDSSLLKAIPIRWTEMMQKDESKGYVKLFLCAAPGQKYNSALVLTAIEKNKVDVKSLIDQVYRDLKAMLNTIYDDKTPDVATAIVIDLDEEKCEKVTCTKLNTSVDKLESASFVYDFLKQFLTLKEVGMSDSSCDTFLNDKLQELFSKSYQLQDILNSVTKITIGEVAKILNLDQNDVRLLLDLLSVYNISLINKIIS
jgi:hypothetical protein